MQIKLLLKVIKEKIIEQEDTGALSKTTQRDKKRQISNFQNKQGSVSYTESFIDNKIDIWDAEKLQKFLMNVVKKLPEYNELISKLSTKYKLNERFVDWHISNFLGDPQWKVFERIQEDKEEVLESLIRIFLNDLQNKPVEWICKIWVSGIWTSEVHTIGEKLIIKPTSHLDVEGLFFSLKQITPLHLLYWS